MSDYSENFSTFEKDYLRNHPPKAAGVYLITNTANGKRYFGCTQNLQARFSNWKHHFQVAKYYYKNPEGFKERFRWSLNKNMAYEMVYYPKELWTIEVIRFCETKEEAEAIEKNYIMTEKNLYNVMNNPEGYEIQLELPLIFL